MLNNDIPSQAIFTERGHMPKYTEREKKELRVALAILGTISNDRVTDDELDVLGYDLHKMSYYGRPSITDLKRKASDILFDMITKEDEIHIIETDG